jgi:serine phosphatase RsbU (regulator of sigma subunit)
VKKHAGLHCGALFDAILEEISQFAASHEFADDVCLLGVEADEKF